MYFDRCNSCNPERHEVIAASMDGKEREREREREKERERERERGRERELHEDRGNARDKFPCRKIKD